MTLFHSIVFFFITNLFSYLSAICLSQTLTGTVIAHLTTPGNRCSRYRKFCNWCASLELATASGRGGDELVGHGRDGEGGGQEAPTQHQTGLQRRRTRHVGGLSRDVPLFAHIPTSISFSRRCTQRTVRGVMQVAGSMLHVTTAREEEEKEDSCLVQGASLLFPHQSGG